MTMNTSMLYCSEVSLDRESGTDLPTFAREGPPNASWLPRFR